MTHTGRNGRARLHGRGHPCWYPRCRCDRRAGASARAGVAINRRGGARSPQAANEGAAADCERQAEGTYRVQTARRPARGFPAARAFMQHDPAVPPMGGRWSRSVPLVHPPLAQRERSDPTDGSRHHTGGTRRPAFCPDRGLAEASLHLGQGPGEAEGRAQGACGEATDAPRPSARPCASPRRHPSLHLARHRAGRAPSPCLSARPQHNRPHGPERTARVPHRSLRRRRRPLGCRLRATARHASPAPALPGAGEAVVAAVAAADRAPRARPPKEPKRIGTRRPTARPRRGSSHGLARSRASSNRRPLQPRPRPATPRTRRPIGTRRRPPKARALRLDRRSVAAAAEAGVVEGRSRRRSTPTMPTALPARPRRPNETTPRPMSTRPATASDDAAAVKAAARVAVKAAARAAARPRSGSRRSHERSRSRSPRVARLGASETPAVAPVETAVVVATRSCRHRGSPTSSW